MNPIWLLALVPPIAFACGWWLARRTDAGRSGARVNELSSDYFRGLNYLLNEEQDKALEVFLRLAEYNRDTVETHLALGNLFRKRGEVDRAIRLHQHLVSRQGLSDEMKTVALLELGEDYMRAGLLDRAETLFSDLVAMDALAPSALRHLIAIYQPRARVAQGYRPRPPPRGDDRRRRGRHDRPVLLRAGGAIAPAWRAHRGP
jgi:Predicted N-acetylglucosaminyl transferase